MGWHERSKQLRAFVQTVSYIINRVTSLSKYVGFAGLVSAAALMSVATIARYFFNSPFIFTEELVKVFTVLMVTSSLAYVFQIEGHLRADLVTNLLPPKPQAFLRLVSAFLTIMFLAILAREFARQIAMSLSVDRRFETIWIWPEWPVRVIGFLGICLTVVYVTKMFIQGCVMLKRWRGS